MERETHINEIGGKENEYRYDQKKMCWTRCAYVRILCPTLLNFMIEVNTSKLSNKKIEMIPFLNITTSTQVITKI